MGVAFDGVADDIAAAIAELGNATAKLRRYTVGDTTTPPASDWRPANPYVAPVDPDPGVPGFTDYTVTGVRTDKRARRPEGTESTVFVIAAKDLAIVPVNTDKLIISGDIEVGIKTVSIVSPDGRAIAFELECEKWPAIATQ